MGNAVEVGWKAPPPVGWTALRPVGWATLRPVGWATLRPVGWATLRPALTGAPTAVGTRCGWHPRGAWQDHALVTHPYLAGPYPRAYAHRGWHTGDLAGLENTMAAFRRAVEEGFHYLELDVHRTFDGEVVVHHDAVLGRLTEGAAAIADLTWPMLSTVRVGGREPIPRLADVLAELPDTRITVELKSDDVVAPTIRLLDAADCWHRVCVGSFSERRLDAVRRAAGARALTSMGRRSAVALRVRAWSGPRRGARGPAVRGDLAQLPHRYGRITVVDPGLMAAARALGHEVHVWTVDEPAEMHELLDMGVDGLLSDRPDVLRGVLSARGQWT